MFFATHYLQTAIFHAYSDQTRDESTFDIGSRGRLSVYGVCCGLYSERKESAIDHRGVLHARAQRPRRLPLRPTLVPSQRSSLLLRHGHSSVSRRLRMYCVRLRNRDFLLSNRYLSTAATLGCTERARARIAGRSKHISNTPKRLGVRLAGNIVTSVLTEL